MNVEFEGTPVLHVDASTAAASAAAPRWRLDRLDLRLHWGRASIESARNAPEITSADLSGSKGVPPSELLNILAVSEWV